MSRGAEREGGSRHLFALVAGLPAIALVVVGIVLAGHDGVLNVIGVVCLAYGLGIGVASVFIGLNHNPLRKRDVPPPDQVRRRP